MPNATRHTMAIFRIFDSNNSQYTKIKVLFFRHKYLFISITLFLFSLCVFAHFITGMSKEYIFVHRCKSVCTLRINSVVIFYSLCLNNLGICKRFTMDFFLSRMWYIYILYTTTTWTQLSYEQGLTNAHLLDNIYWMAVSDVCCTLLLNFNHLVTLVTRFISQQILNDSSHV